MLTRPEGGVADLLLWSNNPATFKLHCMRETIQIHEKPNTHIPSPFGFGRLPLPANVTSKAGKQYQRLTPEIDTRD